MNFKLKLKAKINAHGLKMINSNPDDASGHFLSNQASSYEATFMLNWSAVGGNWSNKVEISMLNCSTAGGNWSNKVKIYG